MPSLIPTPEYLNLLRAVNSDYGTINKVLTDSRNGFSVVQSEGALSIQSPVSEHYTMVLAHPLMSKANGYQRDWFMQITDDRTGEVLFDQDKPGDMKAEGIAVYVKRVFTSLVKPMQPKHQRPAPPKGVKAEALHACYDECFVTVEDDEGQVYIGTLTVTGTYVTLHTGFRGRPTTLHIDDVVEVLPVTSSNPHIA